MNSLHFVLVMLAVVGVAAAYFWGVQPRRRSNRLIRSPRWRQPTEDKFDKANIVLQELDERVSSDSDFDDESHAAEKKTSRPGPAASASGKKSRSEAVTSAPECVIAIHIMAPDGSHFTGAEIREAAEAVGLRFGAMGVFHHFGVGQLQSGTSLFCLANMFEPGNFDINDLASCQTKGLVLVMRLPLPLDGKVAFELLLNSAYRLVRKLGGELSDERRQPLTPENLQRLRALASAIPSTESGD